VLATSRTAVTSGLWVAIVRVRRAAAVKRSLLLAQSIAFERPRLGSRAARAHSAHARTAQARTQRSELRMPRRVPAAAAALTTASVVLSQPLSPVEASEAAASLVASILFLRGQLPCLHETMLAERDAPGKSRSSVRLQRNALAQLEKFTATLSPEIFADNSLCSLHLLLGSSVARPREVYELHLATGEGRATTGRPGQGRPGRAADVARRAVRALVSALATSPSAAPRQRLFLLLSSAHAHEGCVLRRSLKPEKAFAKARLRIRLSISDSGAAGVAEEAADEPVMVWQARAKFRGLSCTKPQAAGM
jgi:hypothetical protein